EGESVLDVGCGSGVLSVVARLLGAGRVVGIDLSEDAVRESRENARLNGLELEFYRVTPSEVGERFDVVVANLELPIFKKELKNIAPLIHRGAVFSGIYKKEELEEFLEMLEQEGLKVVRILEEEDWFCVGVGDGRN
ncbi:50S ribosomal protein L11 methyltransferase, partial [Hydrogenivirga sp.]